MADDRVSEVIEIDSLKVQYNGPESDKETAKKMLEELLKRVSIDYDLPTGISKGNPDSDIKAYYVPEDSDRKPHGNDGAEMHIYPTSPLLLAAHTNIFMDDVFSIGCIFPDMESAQPNPQVIYFHNPSDTNAHIYSRDDSKALDDFLDG